MLDVVESSTRRLLDSLAVVTDAQVRAPSRLPGWTRGHVLTHIARNADALVNLLDGARTGEPVPMYPSREARNRDIETGADRGAAELLEDLRASHRRFRAAAAAMDGAAWDRTVEWGARPRRAPAALVPVLRAAEVELHRTDLDLGHSPAEWPAELLTVLLPHAVDDLAERAGEPLVLQATDTWATLECGAHAAHTVEGPQASLTAWVTGRSDGRDLVVVPEGDLPQIGDWR